MILKSNNKMLIFKGRVDKILESLALSEDMMNDMLLVDGNRLKMVGTS